MRYELWPSSRSSSHTSITLVLSRTKKIKNGQCPSTWISKGWVTLRRPNRPSSVLYQGIWQKMKRTASRKWHFSPPLWLKRLPLFVQVIRETKLLDGWLAIETNWIWPWSSLQYEVLENIIMMELKVTRSKNPAISTRFRSRLPNLWKRKSSCNSLIGIKW